jgi:hypothetical protein
VITANAIYYTFSTIAQSLAGAIALLGAFVVLRLQSLDTTIHLSANSIKDALSAMSGDTQTAQRLYAHGKYRELLEGLKKGPFTNAMPAEVLTPERQALAGFLDSRELLLRRFKVAFYLTIALIFASVGTLPFAEQIACNTCVAWPAFGVGLAWLAACLGSYVWVMYGLLQTKSK